MIVAKVEEARERIAYYHQLERSKEEATNLRDTLAALTEVRAQVLAQEEIYRLIEERLSQATVAGINVLIHEVARAIAASQADFNVTLRQVTALGRVRPRLQMLATALDEAWATWARRQTEPLFELFQLVSALPELASQQVELAQLRQYLLTRRDRAPRDQGELSAFEQRVAELSEHLRHLEGLNAEVRHFLRQVVDRSASINDLNDEVLAWCRQGGRAAAFRISFHAPAAI